MRRQLLSRLFLAGTAALFVTAVPALARDKSVQVFSKFERLSQSPVLGPRAGKFDSAGAFNPAATRIANGNTVLLYRGQDERGISRVGYAESTDGIHFTPEDMPAIEPTLADESDGIEDPRLTLSFDSKQRWLATATAYSKATGKAQLVSYRSQANDLHHFERVAVLMPASGANADGWNVHWTKSGAIVVDEHCKPVKIKNKYWMYYMADARVNGKIDADQMGVASSSDGITWQDALGKPILAHRSNMFDSRVVEPGPHPIMTRDGILLLYNGGDDNLTYCTGWALFDKKNPTRVLGRAAEPIFSPELAWEKKNASATVHQVPNVVFVEGIVPNADGTGYLVYYGSADSYVGVAFTKLEPLFK